MFVLCIEISTADSVMCLIRKAFGNAFAVIPDERYSSVYSAIRSLTVT